jgi:hypothetical protein
MPRILGEWPHKMTWVAINTLIGTLTFQMFHYLLEWEHPTFWALKATESILGALLWQMANKVLHVIFLKFILHRAPVLKPNAVVNLCILLWYLKDLRVTNLTLLLSIQAFVADEFLAFFAWSWVDHEREALLASEYFQ